MAFRAVKGMNDILPDEVERWQFAEAAFRDAVRCHGYAEVRTPIVEPTALFVRSIGENTDVVEKEMYTFERHDDSLTLRPEGTAGAVRAYIERTTHAKEPVSRWYYLGPMFRAERPQRGRYRQFYQAGCEVYGDKGPTADAEMITMLYDFFLSVGITGLDVKVNSLGGADTRKRYHEALTEYFRPRLDQLSVHAQIRVEDNPLRILDSKDPKDQKAAEGAPSILDMLDEADRDHFSDLCKSLVRGLDYYTRTLFEIASTARELGSQNALAGGGRYDNLVQALGGPPVPAIGFALGLERLILAIPARPAKSSSLCFFAPLGAAAARRSLVLARDVRRRGFVTEVDGRGGSLKSLLRRADALGARCAVVIGDSELAREAAIVKDLTNHTQELVNISIVGQAVEKLLESAANQSSGEVN
jgi:histidyl-tRNA synthetase